MIVEKKENSLRNMAVYVTLIFMTVVSVTLVDGQPVPEGTRYYDLTLPRRLRLGAIPFVNPGALRNISLGYTSEITPRNSVDLCQRVQQGEGLLGIMLGRGVIVVPQTDGITCGDQEQSQVFIGPDREDGSPVIAWDAHE